MKHSDSISSKACLFTNFLAAYNLFFTINRISMISFVTCSSKNLNLTENPNEYERRNREVVEKGDSCFFGSTCMEVNSEMTVLKDLFPDCVLESNINFY